MIQPEGDSIIDEKAYQESGSNSSQNDFDDDKLHKLFEQLVNSAILESFIEYTKHREKWNIPNLKPG